VPQGQAGGDPAHRRRAPAPVPGLGRRGRPPRPVATERHRGGGGVGLASPAPGTARLGRALRRRPVRRRTPRRRDLLVGATVTSPRRSPRTARLNEVMLEVLADELERLSDPRLGFVTLTGVEVNRDLSKASVYYS